MPDAVRRAALEVDHHRLLQHLVRQATIGCGMVARRERLLARRQCSDALESGRKPMSSMAVGLVEHQHFEVPSGPRSRSGSGRAGGPAVARSRRRPCGTRAPAAPCRPRRPRPRPTATCAGRARFRCSSICAASSRVGRQHEGARHPARLPMSRLRSAARTPRSCRVPVIRAGEQILPLERGGSACSWMGVGSREHPARGRRAGGRRGGRTVKKAWNSFR